MEALRDVELGLAVAGVLCTAVFIRGSKMEWNHLNLDRGIWKHRFDGPETKMFPGEVENAEKGAPLPARLCQKWGLFSAELHSPA